MIRQSKTILIADDDVVLVQAIALRCQSIGLNVIKAFNAHDALKLVYDSRPDVICLDVNMPGGNGLSVCEMLANDLSCSSTPVIVMTGDANTETIRRCHRLCAYYVEKCANVWPRIESLLRELLHLESPVGSTPVSDQPQRSFHQPAISIRTSEPGKDDDSSRACRLMDAVFEMLGTNPTLFADDQEETAQVSEPPWVLCIDDDADYSLALKLRLESHGVAVVRAFEGMEGFRCAFTRPADVILLDYELPNGQGDYILRRLKENPVTKSLPVVVITGHRDRLLERRMLELGAAKFMNKPPDFAELLAELRKHISILPRAVEA